MLISSVHMAIEVFKTDTAIINQTWRLKYSIRHGDESIQSDMAMNVRPPRPARPPTSRGQAPCEQTDEGYFAVSAADLASPSMGAILYFTLSNKK